MAMPSGYVRTRGHRRVGGTADFYYSRGLMPPEGPPPAGSHFWFSRGTEKTEARLVKNGFYYKLYAIYRLFIPQPCRCPLRASINCSNWASAQNKPSPCPLCLEGLSGRRRAERPHLPLSNKKTSVPPCSDIPERQNGDKSQSGFHIIYACLRPDHRSHEDGVWIRRDPILSYKFTENRDTAFL
jgi:hypothetical protein